ncbi:hypothetical protein D7M24_21780 [Salmonella enterica]|nr:hypothetical protein [Salmonella enterica]
MGILVTCRCELNHYNLGYNKGQDIRCFLYYEYHKVPEGNYFVLRGVLHMQNTGCIRKPDCDSAVVTQRQGADVVNFSG